MGVFWRRVALLILAVAGIVGTAAALTRATGRSQARVGPILQAAQRGTLEVTVTERGTLASSRNTEIKCEIRGGYGGRGGESTVTWIVPAGSIVQEGDELVRLDTKVIEETVSLGKTDTNLAKADLARAQADLAKAKIAVDGYVNGAFRSEMKALAKEREEKSRNLRTASKMLTSAKQMFQKGFMTELEVEGTEYTVEQAELEHQVVETRIDVLSRLTKAMVLETLNGQLVAAEARVAGRKAGVQLEQGRLDLAEQELKRCLIRAPRSGLVIYPSAAKWKDAPDVTEGASVRNNQLLLIMPDVSKMQVKIGIHESIIDRVHAGQKVTVELPNRTLTTEVTSVASVASPVGWWTGDTVRYDATIDLPPVEGLKPGMSAEVSILMARHEDAIHVPLSSVIETSQGHFCWISNNGQIERREIGVGDNNDESIVVESGIQSADLVIVNPLDVIEEARELLAPSMVHRVSERNLVVTLTEQGTLESSNNTQVKCRVRGASTVNWVIESGMQVREGDELVTLENKQIEEFLHARTKFAFLSKDAAVGFRAHERRAKLAIAEYLEGRFETELMTLKKDLAIASERLGTARNMLQHAESMRDRGYISELELEQRRFAVTEAELTKQNKEIEIDVLNRFTKKEQLSTLRGDWEAAKAAANGHEEVLRMDEQRIKLAQQEIKLGVIRAPRDGLVIYPRNDEWKDAPDIAEGATVRKDQVLLLMPDLSKMQVRVGIHETMADQIEPGMKARVTVPGGVLEGEVSTIALAAKPAGWWSGNIVKYDAVIRLPSTEGLKPGMSAKVEIVISQHENVLTIPLGAVLEDSEGVSCLVGTPENSERREIQIGQSDDTDIIVVSGLSSGEQVVLKPITQD